MPANRGYPTGFLDTRKAPATLPPGRGRRHGPRGWPRNPPRRPPPTFPTPPVPLPRTMGRSTPLARAFRFGGRLSRAFSYITWLEQLGQSPPPTFPAGYVGFTKVRERAPLTVPPPWGAIREPRNVDFRGWHQPSQSFLNQQYITWGNPTVIPAGWDGFGVWVGVEDVQYGPPQVCFGWCYEDWQRNVDTVGDVALVPGHGVGIAEVEVPWFIPTEATPIGVPSPIREPFPFRVIPYVPDSPYRETGPRPAPTVSPPIPFDDPALPDPDVGETTIPPARPVTPSTPVPVIVTGTPGASGVLPLPFPTVRPGTSPAPAPGPGPRPVPSPAPAPAPVQPLAPPKVGTKERKLRVGAWYGAILGAVNVATEGMDLVDTLHGAIPKRLRTRNAKPEDMLADIYRHWTSIDVALAVKRFADNQIEDALYGAIGQANAKASRRFGDETGRLVGFQRGDGLRRQLQPAPDDPWAPTEISLAVTDWVFRNVTGRDVPRP